MVWNLIAAILGAVTLISTPMTWFRRRRRRRLHRRLVAVVHFPGDTHATLLEFKGNAAVGVRSMMSLDNLAFLFDLEERMARGISLTADERQRAQQIIDQAASAWLQTPDGQSWLSTYLS
jgi:hypothetical protein